MRLRLSLALLVILLVPPASAMASGRDVLRDCADDEVLSKTYTQKEYRDALNRLATDSAEYSDCESVIRRAQLAAAASGGSGGGSDSGSSSGGGGQGGGGAPTGSGNDSSSGATSGSSSSGGSGASSAPAPPAALTPDDQQAIQQAQASGGDGLDTAAALAALPDASRAPAMTGDGGLPGPVIGLLILLAGTLVYAGAARLHTRVLARRAG